MQTNFITDRNPTTSGLYIVDRDKLGQPCRWYNKDKDQWSLCAYGAEDALAVKDVPTAIGFLPWKGPVSVKDVPKAVPQVALVAGAKPAKAPKVAKVAAEVKPKVTKTPKVKTAKVVHPDGTVFFREDRQKWVVVVDGKQPAARPTKEGVIKWLQSKHPEIKPIIVE